MYNLHKRLKFIEGKQKELFEKYMEYCGVSSQRELAKLLEVNRSTLKNWMNERLTLPCVIFEKICFEFKEANEFNKFITQSLPDNWGAKKGGDFRTKQIKNINNYFKVLRNKKEEKRQKYHLNLKKKIDNKQLYFIDKKVDINCLLATYILTDGSLLNKNGNYRIGLYTKDEILKDISYSLLFKKSRYIPSLTKTKKGVYFIRVNDNYLAGELLKINSSYKKLPSKNQSIKEYYKEVQPSLEFIKKANKETLIYCIRLAFSTDGYISLSKNGTITAGITCYHPNLCKEWVKILSLCNLKSTIINRKNSWCGVSEIRLPKESIPIFWEIGGFINGVKISNKSKKYNGWTKNSLLEKVIKEKYGPVA